MWACGKVRKFPIIHILKYSLEYEYIILQMGWHYELNVICNILPEFYPFMKDRHLCENYTLTWNDDSNQYYVTDISGNKITHLSNEYLDVIRNWLDIDLLYHDFGTSSHPFRLYQFSEITGIFKCNIEKKVINHMGNLWEDYESFLKDVIVPISSEITYCCISSDDYGEGSMIYTDMQLRGKSFSLHSLVSNYVHTYDKEGNIIGTKLRYKYPITPSQLMDLNRCIMGS